MLWPYRRSALKNQQRWTFGGVFRRVTAPASGRPLQRCRRSASSRAADARSTCACASCTSSRAGARRAPATRRRAARRRGLPAWDEATERELTEAGAVAIEIAAGREEEPLEGGALRVPGSRSRAIEVSAEPRARGSPAHRRVANAAPWAGDDREDGARRPLCSTHAVLRARTALRLATDPPEQLREAAALRERGALAGAGRRAGRARHDARLADHPRRLPADRAREPGRPLRRRRDRPAADPEHPRADRRGEEEMRATDPRAREILERSEALPPRAAAAPARRDPRLRRGRA